MLSSLLWGTLLAALFYGVVWPLGSASLRGTLPGTVHAMFYDRGFVPYAEVFCAGWALAILFIKWRKLAFQRRALQFDVVPPAADFVLSPDTADAVLSNIERLVDHPRHFVLFSRLSSTLSNLRNLGRVGDVDEILSRQADIADGENESSYGLLKGLIWAIPVLGFIGTVIGLSEAIGSFGSVLSDNAGVEDLKGGLQNVTAGLSVAFDTTLTGLLLALIAQLLMVVEKSAEQQFLDDCREYCHRRLVGRLRLLPLEGGPVLP
jgi:biopolymer transport protein ExbB/TolQ